jgi:hypothetical protein
MKKGGVKILLAVLVLVLLVAAFVLVQRKNAADQSAEEEEASANESTEYVLDSSVQNSTFSTFSYRSASGEEVRLERRDGDWYYTGDEKMVIDSDAISEFLSSFVTLEAKRVITEPGELSEYGLDTPSNVLTYETEDGEEGTVLFGDINSTTKDLYIMIEGKDVVYTVDSEAADTFSAEPQTLALDTESE